MDRSFDPTNMTLDAAADMVAVRARLGVSRSMREKQALSTGSAALLGGGLGLGTGLISTLMSKKKDEEKQYMRNALLGALLGAGIGGGAGALANNFSAASGSNTPEGNARDELQKLIDKNQANRSGAWSLGVIDNVLPGNSGLENVDISKWSPEDQANFAKYKTQLQSSGYDTGQLGLNTGDGTFTGLAKQVLPAVGNTGVGYGAGWLYDIAKHRMTGGQSRKPVTLQEIVAATHNGPGGQPAKLTDQGFKGTEIGERKGGQPSLLEQLRGATVTRERGPAKRTPSIPGPRGTSLPGIPYWPGRVTERVNVPDATHPTGVKELTISPHSTQVLREAVQSGRERSAKPGRGGRMFGLGAGVLGFLFSGQGQQTAPGTAPRN